MKLFLHSSIWGEILGFTTHGSTGLEINISFQTESVLISTTNTFHFWHYILIKDSSLLGVWEINVANTQALSTSVFKGKCEHCKIYPSVSLLSIPTVTPSSCSLFSSIIPVTSNRFSLPLTFLFHTIISTLIS